jgi:23S rRNA (adenine2503-C2)-methyltransferase
MKVIGRTEENDIATVFVAENHEGKLFEFVESTQPPLTRHEKWVLIISTLFGCPVKCTFCDAGGRYDGKLSYEELKFQIDYLINTRFPEGYIDSAKFKIQFARMGEPSFNPAVLELLRNIPALYDYRLFLPSLSTIAPVGTDDFFEELRQIKKELYSDTFQLQFSLHSTDEKQRDELLPVKKWGFEKIAEFSERFYDAGGKKITLNFALSQDSIFEPEQLLKYFDPEIFLLKITPVNPTYQAEKNNIKSLITEKNHHKEIVERAKAAGYGVILSIGEWEENKIGSNCGQYITALRRADVIENAYEYDLLTL